MRFDTTKYTKMAHRFKNTGIELEEKTIAMVLQYFDAMSNLYNLMPVEKVLGIINAQNEEQLCKEDFYRLMEMTEMEKVFYAFLSPAELMDENAVSPPSERYLMQESLYAVDGVYEEILKAQFGKSFYIPEKEELLRYADDAFFGSDISTENFTHYFREVLHLNAAETSEYLDETLIILEHNRELDRLFFDYARMGLELTLDQIKELMPILTELASQVRSPYYCGHTAAEVGVVPAFPKTAEEMYQEASRTMDMFGQMRTLLAMKGMMPPDMMKQPSKNGPCPCGSGKKYKRCCGKGK